MAHVIDSARDFQADLRALLVRFNMTTACLVPIGSAVTTLSDEEQTESEASECEFDVDLGLVDFIERYFANWDPIGRSQKSYSRMFELLRRKAHTACQKNADGLDELRQTISEQDRRISKLRSCLVELSGEVITNSSDDHLIRRVFDVHHHQQEKLEQLGAAIAGLKHTIEGQDEVNRDLESQLASLQESAAAMRSAADRQTMTIRKMNETESRLCELLHVPTDSLIDSVSNVIQDSGNFRAIQAIHNEVRGILADGNQPDDLVSLSRRALTRQNNDRQIRSILNRISPAAQGQATLNHAENCAASYRLLYDQNQGLLNGFAQILEIVGSKCVTNDVIVSTTIQAVKTLTRQPQEVLCRIAKEFCGSEMEPTEQDIVRQFRRDRESLTNLQKAYTDFEAAASRFIDIPKCSKKPDFLKVTIKTLENRQNDSKLL
jgi:uncharacterized coiled-coil protein SlyX